MKPPSDGRPLSGSASAGSLDRRRDAAVMGVLLLVAAAIRVWHFDRVGLIHFDEGGYALSALAWFEGRGPSGFMPQQHLLSPPLHFSLGAALMNLLGRADDRALTMISLVAGAATIPLLYDIGRGWFGRTAGLFAALVFTASDLHVALSRMALTDALFTFLFLAALRLHSIADAKRSWRWSMAAGLAVGLAWNTKYHGWLVGAVQGAALGHGWLRTRRLDTDAALRLVASMVLAALLYLPWFMYVRSLPEGLAGLARNHKVFLTGLGPKWFSNAWTQIGSLVDFDGWPSRLSVSLAALAGLWSALRRNTGGLRRTVTMVWLVVAAIVSAGGLPVLVGAGVLSSVVLARRQDRDTLRLVWLFWIFALLLPCYRPYARLGLPMLAAAALCCGAVLEKALSTFDGMLSRLRSAGTWCLTGLGLVAIVASMQHSGPPAARAWDRSDGLRIAAQELAAALPVGADVAVVAEPEVVFYLRQAGIAARHAEFPPAAEPGTNPNGSHVVVGIYARRSGAFERWARRQAGGVRPWKSIGFDVNFVRRLDDYPPFHDDPGRRQTYALEVYRVD